MASGISNIFNTATQGLFAFRSALEVTSNNVSNVNTPGYSRQELRLQDGAYLTVSPGQIGTGVNATDVIRHFDNFVEGSYLAQSGLSNRYATLYQELRGVDSMLNESNSDGVSTALSTFFNSWQDLSVRPEDYGAREQLLSDTQTLTSVLRQASDQLERMQQQTTLFIRNDVNTANQLMRDIADMNRQIAITEVPGLSNANGLRDRRDQLVRDLGGLIDVKVLDQADGNFVVTTAAGQTLVDGVEHFELSFEGPQSTTSLSANSNFDGKAYFDGADDFEYTIDVVAAGDVSSLPVAPAVDTAAQFRVSLDGGRTWLKDENGQDMLFRARPESEKVTVGDVKIWFGSKTDQNALPANNMSAGDSFNIVPKDGLYWYKNGTTKENITPQLSAGGSETSRRISGGELAGLFIFRDANVGRYKEKLDSFSQSLIWEVNRIHSQGAGLENMNFAQGGNSVARQDIPLGDPSSGLAFGDRLQAGGASIHVYDSAGNLVNENLSDLDFDSVTPGMQGFDPSVHTLEDVRQAVQGVFDAAGVGGSVKASTANGSLRIQASGGYTFAFGEDSAGLYAGLGMNSFLTGDSAVNIGVNDDIANNISHLAAGHVNGSGEVNQGDGFTASAIGALKDKTIVVRNSFEGRVSQTLSGYYNSLVTNVGADTAAAKFSYEYQDALATDLDNRQQEVSGVNLDEEMSNLIKYQHSYTAAAKLINTADQMIQTLLGLKQ